MDYKTLEIRGAKIMGGNFRNFRKGKYGYSFCIDLTMADSVHFGDRVIADPNELINALVEDKWDVRYTQPSSAAYEPTPFLQVKINFENKFNRPYVVANGVDLDEKALPTLQDVRFSNVDVAINPSRPTERRDGSFKRTAYLTSLHVDFSEDGDYRPERYEDPFAK